MKNLKVVADRQIETILGCEITTASLKSCIDQILLWINSNQKRKYFVCTNPHSIVEAESDPIFKKALKNADLIVPDGIGIVIASTVLGGNIRSRITGSDVFTGVNSAINKSNGYSVFFLGSTEETLAKIRNKMSRKFPNIKVAGTYSPPFKSEFNNDDNRLMVKAINRVRPDVLWIGMTAPKQEKWIYVNKERLDVKFIGAIGAVFDFYAGKVKRSHPIFQKIGLEWLPRLIREPKRLFKRNFISTPRFLIMILADKFAGTINKK